MKSWIWSSIAVCEKKKLDFPWNFHGIYFAIVFVDKSRLKCNALHVIYLRNELSACVLLVNRYCSLSIVLSWWKMKKNNNEDSYSDRAKITVNESCYLKVSAWRSNLTREKLAFTIYIYTGKYVIAMHSTYISGVIHLKAGTQFLLNLRAKVARHIWILQTSIIVILYSNISIRETSFSANGMSQDKTGRPPNVSI